MQDLGQLAVCTESVERYQFAMTSAVHAMRPALLRGPPLAGKRTMFKDLAARLGRFHVVCHR